MFKSTQSHDETTYRNYIKIWKDLVEVYEKVKSKQHPTINKADDFYKLHKICRQNFRKFYVRFKTMGVDEAFLPRCRGPKYGSRRPDLCIELDVLEARKSGINKYEIHDYLKPKYQERTPSASAIYRILCRYGKNRLDDPMKETKRRIIKEKAGDLGHIDCHQLPKGLVAHETQKRYLVAVVDDCSRLAWCELVDDLTSLSVMFGVMRCFTALKASYGIEFIEVLTDNGAEFGGNSKHDNVNITNPVRRFFYEVGIKHRYTRPYRPQTNGKVERFWRTLNEDFVDGTVFTSEEELREELFKYLIYYNEYRPHQGINGKKPAEFNAELPKKRTENDGYLSSN